MSVGSPALAAYSLLLTSLNARTVYHRMKTSHYEHKKSLANVLVSIQQTPLALTDDPRLLDYILNNRRWREDIEERLKLTNFWPIKAVLFVAWVAAPFVFTVVSAFVSLDDPSDSSYDGYSTGILWLWLLCLVIGWLWVPTFPGNELRSALSFANQQAVKRSIKTLRRAKEKARMAMRSAKNKITNRPRRGIPIPKGHKGLIIETLSKFPKESETNEESILPRSKKRVDPVPEFNEEDEKLEVESIQEDTKQKADPPPNRPHRQSTAASQSHTDDQLDYDFLTISASSDANHSVASMSHSTQPSINPETDELFIPQKLTSLNRDEHRLTPTFNYSRVVRYLVLVDDVLQALDKLAWGKGEVGLSRERLVEVVSLILNRREALSLGLYPLCPRKRRLCSLRAHSLRCSKRRLWPSFSNAE